MDTYGTYDHPSRKAGAKWYQYWRPRSTPVRGMWSTGRDATGTRLGWADGTNTSVSTCPERERSTSSHKTGCYPWRIGVSLSHPLTGWDRHPPRRTWLDGESDPDIEITPWDPLLVVPNLRGTVMCSALRRFRGWSAGVWAYPTGKTRPGHSAGRR